MYILKLYSIPYTLRKNANVKEYPLGKINDTKNALFFLLRALTHHSFSFNSRFLSELKHNPTGIYLLKVNNRNTRTRFEICLKLTIKIPERRHGIFLVSFLLTLNIFHTLF